MPMPIQARMRSPRLNPAACTIRRLLILSCPRIWVRRRPPVSYRWALLRSSRSPRSRCIQGPLAYGSVHTVWSVARLGTHLQKCTGIRISCDWLANCWIRRDFPADAPPTPWPAIAAAASTGRQKSGWIDSKRGFPASGHLRTMVPGRKRVPPASAPGPRLDEKGPAEKGQKPRQRTRSAWFLALGATGEALLSTTPSHGRRPGACAT